MKKGNNKKSNIKSLSFDHVHYRSSSFAKTRQFYVDIMGGVELAFERLGRQEHMHIELGGVTLLFARKKDGIPMSADGLGPYHIAFLVEDCMKAAAYYKKRGAKVAKQYHRYSDTIVATFLTAPDGMMVELKEIKPMPLPKKKKKK